MPGQDLLQLGILSGGRACARRAEDLVADLGADPPEERHVGAPGRRSAAGIRGSRLHDEAGETARRDHGQCPARADSGHGHGVYRPDWNGEDVAGRSTAVRSPAQTVNSPSRT